MYKDLKYLLKRYKLHFDWIALQSDKNNGIVLVNQDWWLKFNEHLTKQKQFKLIYTNIDNHKKHINNIINNAKSNTINIVNEYDHLFTDTNGVYKLISNPKYNIFGKYRGQPKVHKKDANGNPKKAMRGLINLSKCCISITSIIVQHLSRKFVIGIRNKMKLIIECDDIQEMTIKIDEYNDNHNINTNKNSYLFDINSMYDLIPN